MPKRDFVSIISLRILIMFPRIDRVESEGAHMKRIIIVDDFDAGRLVLHERLKLEGYLCQEVKDGSEALNTLQMKHFDLVSTDHHMPVMTGLQMLQCLAERPKDQRPSVIFITGHPSSELSVAAQSAGARAVFDKPYDDQDFLAEVTRILNQPSGIQTSCQSSLPLSEDGET